ncbi:MAG: methyltransferase domain-containing protein [Methanolinea sp.]|nr:methyltransferase domain-containing protein [Methanolinea sp.]
MHLLLELAGDNPDLPFLELDLLGPVVERSDQVAVVDCRFPGGVPRLALTHVAMEFLGSCPARKDDMRSMLRDLGLSTERPFAARVRKIHGCTTDASQADLERLIGSEVKGRVDLSHPGEEFRAVISGNRCYLGRVLWRSDPRQFSKRRPGTRPFFHPGVMMPRMVRALVNISCVKAGERLLDPFCGTGGMVLEAALLGVIAVGSDRDPYMVRGSRMNVPGEDIVLADGMVLPFHADSFDAVVTDLPYGQSVSIHAKNLELLVSGALEEVARVLKPGRRAVVVSSRPLPAREGGDMEVISTCSQRVHRSLTRHIHVLAKKGKGTERGGAPGPTTVFP